MVKDHEKRELVYRLTKLAQEFAETQQLRARIAGEVLPAIDAVVAAERERWRSAVLEMRGRLLWLDQRADTREVDALLLGPNVRANRTP